MIVTMSVLKLVFASIGIFMPACCVALKCYQCYSDSLIDTGCGHTSFTILSAFHFDSDVHVKDGCHCCTVEQGSSAKHDCVREERHCTIESFIDPTAVNICYTDRCNTQFDPSLVQLPQTTTSTTTSTTTQTTTTTTTSTTFSDPSVFAEPVSTTSTEYFAPPTSTSTSTTAAGRNILPWFFQDQSTTIIVNQPNAVENTTQTTTTYGKSTKASLHFELWQSMFGPSHSGIKPIWNVLSSAAVFTSTLFGLLLSNLLSGTRAIAPQ